MSIALRHITLAYGRRILLRDVSASVPPGSLTALIGRNGTGKSTLLRAVAGLGAAASGAEADDRAAVGLEPLGFLGDLHDDAGLGAPHASCEVGHRQEPRKMAADAAIGVG